MQPLATSQMARDIELTECEFAGVREVLLGDQASPLVAVTR
jgi:hypothetical protein